MVSECSFWFARGECEDVLEVYKFTAIFVSWSIKPLRVKCLGWIDIKFVQMFMVPRQWILMTLVILWSVEPLNFLHFLLLYLLMILNKLWTSTFINLTFLFLYNEHDIFLMPLDSLAPFNRIYFSRGGSIPSREKVCVWVFAHGIVFPVQLCNNSHV